MADGYLNFDTTVNTDGFNKGTKSISNSLGGLKSAFGKVAAAAAAAFSVTAIIKYTKESKEAYDTQMLAEQKLETIMRQRMNATDESIKSIKEFASAQQELGVIGDEVQLAGAQQVATFLNEADSIKTLLPAMNNLIAQQKGMNATSEDAVSIANLMGKVMQGQTSALTRVGITFTEAEEQVLKYGTESEKAAMLAQVITNNVGEMNSVLAKTDAGRQVQLSNTMGDIKEQFGAAVTQIQVLFLPLLQKLASGLAYVAQLAKNVSQAIADAFGSAGISTSASTLASDSETAADNYASIAESAEETTEQQENQLASFDKINRLDDGSDNSTGSTDNALSSAAGGTAVLTVDTDTSAATKKITSLIKSVKKTFKSFEKYINSNFGGIFEGVFDGLAGEGAELAGTFSRISADIKSLAEPLKAYFANDFTPYLKTVFTTLGNIAVGLFDTFNMVFADIWDIAVFPILQNLVNEGLPLVTQFATQMWLTIDTAFAAVKEIFDTLWNDAVVPILSELTTIWTDTVTLLKSKWDEWGAPIFDSIRDAITNTKDTILHAWEAYFKPIFDNAMERIDEIWNDHLKPLLDNFFDFVGELISGALEIYNSVILPIINWVIDKLYKPLSKIINKIVDLVSVSIKGMIDSVNGIITALRGVVKFITGVFTGDWDKAWEGIKQIFKGIWDSFVSIVKIPLNTIIGLINGLTSAIAKALNGILDGFEGLVNNVIDGINSISVDLPEAVAEIVGFDHIGFDLPNIDIGGIDIPEIPKLATGTVVPANYGEFMAVLGDNKREAEIVSPLSTMRQAVLEALVAYGGNGQKLSLTLPITLNGRIISQIVIDDINEYIRRNGRSPIKA